MEENREFHCKLIFCTRPLYLCANTFMGICYLCGFLLFPFHLSAHTLTEENNVPLTTDTLFAYKLFYTMPADTGLNCIWDFSNFSTDSAEVVEVSYYKTTEGDMTHIGLHREYTNYYYYIAEDTLWLAGYETSRAVMTYVSRIPLLHFPFAYGDTLCGQIVGTGQFCHNSLRTEGVSHIKADATGLLIVPGDTIEHALRVYTRMEYCEAMHSQNHVQEERYTWYSPYCRYPMVESVLVQTIKDTDTISFASTYYYPQEQNEELRRKDVEETLNVTQQDSLVTSICFMPNPVYNDVQIQYSLARQAQVYLSIHYNGGVMTYQSAIHQEEEGDHSVSVNMSGMPIGSYVVYIHADDIVVSGSLIKL